MNAPTPVAAQVNPVFTDGVAKVFVGACETVTVAQAKYIARQIVAAAQWAAEQNRITKDAEFEARIASYRASHAVAA